MAKPVPTALTGGERRRLRACAPQRARGAIFVLNLLLGWTLFGWVAALVWACMNPGTASADDRAPCPYCREPIIATARLPANYLQRRLRQRGG